MKTRTRLLLAVFLALLSAGSFFGAYYFYFKPVRVVVAARDFMPGDTVTPDGVMVKTVSIGDVTPGTIAHPETIIGKRVGVTVFSGQMFIDRMFSAGKVEGTQTLLPVANPITAPVQVGQKVEFVVVSDGGPMSLGEVNIHSIFEDGDRTVYLVGVPKTEAPRYAYVITSAKKIYFFPMAGGSPE